MEINENELYVCPCCKEEKTEEELDLINETFNTDRVCDNCIENGYYE